jgi:hypothetical protein
VPAVTVTDVAGRRQAMNAAYPVIRDIGMSLSGWTFGDRNTDPVY